MEAEDEEVYRRWVAGDLAAGDELFDRYFEPVERFIATKVRDPSEISELVSQTFEVCARSLGRFKQRSSFRTYVFGIANNVARDYLKKLARRSLLDLRVVRVADLDPMGSALCRKREQQQLLDALRALPVDLQTVVELSYFEGMTRRELAETLGLAPGTVASRLRKAREQLHKLVTAR